MEFTYTHIHGIAWRDVMAAPTFAEIWPELCTLLDGARFLAAHNARFDRAVLEACCRRAGLRVPALPFRCTVQLARRVWGLSPTTLPAVCRRLGIPLRHHDAGSDAEACARVVLAAAQEGLRMGESKEPPEPGRPRRRELRNDRVQEDRHRRGP
jgi:DNA polymerase-3 subunit epsilon